MTEERDSLCDKNSQAANATGSLPKKSTNSGDERLEVVAGEELFETVDVHCGELASVEDLIEDSDCELVEDNEAHRVADSAVDPGADSEEPAAETEQLRADTEEHLAEADQMAGGEDSEEESQQNGKEQAAEDTEHGPSCDCLDCDDADFLHGFVDGEPWGIK